jgi:hypothetical protein
LPIVSSASSRGLTYEQIVWTEPPGRKYWLLRNRPGITYGTKTRQEQEKALAEFDALPRPKKPPGRR